MARSDGEWFHLRAKSFAISPRRFPARCELWPDHERHLGAPRQSVNRRDYAAFNVIEHYAQGKRGHGLYTLLGLDVVKDSKLRARCISNLDRLGIIRISGETASNHGEYEEIKKLIEADFSQDVDTWSSGKSIEVTPFGQQFLDTCVRVRRS